MPLVLSPPVRGNLWEDETIVPARLPRDSLQVRRMIGSGAYTEVYLASYQSCHDAVKMLEPERRRSEDHANALLAEAKLMAKIEHPNIVRLIGVAWDSPTDLCLVSEYMEGGNLRTLLDSYAAQGHPVGFDRTKMKIAMHVASALTYPHSRTRPVVHRDVKSKNILLSAELEAQLTGFSGHRDRTVIADGFWMAPEVILGKKYDEKADIFSFGVVLSELSTHKVPYSNTKERKLLNAAILQMVRLGKLRPEFSTVGPKAVAALGEACMAMDRRSVRLPLRWSTNYIGFLPTVCKMSTMKKAKQVDCAALSV